MANQFDITYVFDFLPKLLSYINITLFIVACSMGLGLVIGFIVALPRLYKVPILQRISQIYVSFFRGTPILIQLFLIYYGLPEMLKVLQVDVSKAPVLTFVILTFALHSGAYISEVIRAAVKAVDRGQMEAAYAIGMTGYQAFTRIIMPQAVAIALPNFTNLLIANLKDTSLAFSLGAMELMGKAQTLGSATQHFIETYISLSIIYFVICFGLEKLFVYIERRLLQHEQPIVSQGRQPLTRRWWKGVWASQPDKGGYQA
ncbi:amino acid ABC transporter permease [Paenibacillus aceris]|uniref:L-cystine transport system permease protein n=1 Tax=Paenibacillus aceris TaxID=869555 RepID=A0ABS4I193_9BACL|nr:amino acid ABC transporter permease [Paenibacillus aceris]MBP1964687.1 L-cystine transport system permease protein [Paenibacillus aceris]NHW33674.1 amino acid ABC transporter permease [Paenibacillus aceris]